MPSAPDDRSRETAATSETAPRSLVAERNRLRNGVADRRRASKRIVIAAAAISVVFGGIPGSVHGQSAAAAVNVGSKRTLTGTRPNGSAALFSAADSGGTVLGDTSKPKAVKPTVPTRNPYVGAQFGYSLNGSGGPSGNLIAAGSVMYSVIAPDAKNAAKDRFFLPIRGNLAGLTSDSTASSKKVQQLLSSVQGIRIAAEPYLLIGGDDSYFHPALFGSAGWKINSGKDKTDTTRYMTAGQASFGGELGLGPSDGSKLPVTIDLAYMFTAFADRNYRAVLGSDFPKSVHSGVLTMVLPVMSNTGVLSELTFGQRTLPSWRIGAVFIADGSK